MIKNHAEGLCLWFFRIKSVVFFSIMVLVSLNENKNIWSQSDQITYEFGGNFKNPRKFIFSHYNVETMIPKKHRSDKQNDIVFHTIHSYRRLSSQNNLLVWNEFFHDFGPSTSLIIGILLTIVGSVFMAFGSTIMKLGLQSTDIDVKNRIEAYNDTNLNLKNSLIDKFQKDSVSKSFLSICCKQCPTCEPIWFSGFASYSFGAIFHIVALGFAPASVLAPMNSIGLIANAISASTILKEPYGFMEGIFTSGMTLGIFLCALSSLYPQLSNSNIQIFDISENNEGKDNRYALIGLMSWKDPWYLSFLAICIALGFGSMIYTHNEETQVIEEREKIMNRNHHDKLVEMQSMTKIPNIDGTNNMEISSDLVGVPDSKSDCRQVGQTNADFNALNQKVMSDISAFYVNYSLPIYPKGVGVAYGFLAGLVGAQCVLQLKELVECIDYGFKNPEILNSFQPYLCSVFLIIAVWLQMHFLNLGLARGDATLVVPSYYVFWTLFSTLGGFIKFKEIEGFSNTQKSLFIAGFLLTIFCIMVLAVQEMNFLRRFVDERVPDMPEEEIDLYTQEILDQRLGKQVSLAMGLFPFSMLGRTVGRKRFRPLYQRFRRTRSTVSDTVIGDVNNDMTYTNTLPTNVAYYTLPNNVYFKMFNNGNSDRSGPKSNCLNNGISNDSKTKAFNFKNIEERDRINPSNVYLD